MATISMSLPKFCTAARSTLRPMRPKPLMPTLIVITGNSCALCGSWKESPILAGRHRDGSAPHAMVGKVA